MGEMIIVLVIYVYIYIVLYYPMSPIGRRLGHAWFVTASVVENITDQVEPPRVTRQLASGGCCQNQ